jgi:hypothetical protein
MRLVKSKTKFQLRIYGGYLHLIALTICVLKLSNNQSEVESSEVQNRNASKWTMRHDDLSRGSPETYLHVVASQ